MRRGEARVPGRVPILRQDNMLEACNQVVDQWHDLVPTGHRKRAAGAEIVLHVDDDQCLLVHEKVCPVLDRCRVEVRPKAPASSTGFNLEFDHKRIAWQNSALTIDAALIS